jgi:hypothetical protein
MRKISVPPELAFAPFASIQKKNRGIQLKEYHFIVLKFTTVPVKGSWYVEHISMAFFPGILFPFPGQKISYVIGASKIVPVLN